MESEEFSIGFPKHYPKYYEKFRLALDLCPIMANYVSIGSRFCLYNCRNLNNSGTENNKQWIICSKLNEYKSNKK